MHVVYDRAREKTDSFITLIFVCCVWWGKRKNSFFYNIVFFMLSIMEEWEKTHSLTTWFFLCYLWWSKWKNSLCCNIIFCILSLMEQEKKVILLKHFLYVVYDGGRKKIPSIRTLFYVSFLWIRKRTNSFVFQIIFCLLSMMEQEKKLLHL